MRGNQLGADCSLHSEPYFKGREGDGNKETHRRLQCRQREQLGSSSSCSALSAKPGLHRGAQSLRHKVAAFSVSVPQHRQLCRNGAVWQCMAEGDVVPPDPEVTTGDVLGVQLLVIGGCWAPCCGEELPGGLCTPDAFWGDTSWRSLMVMELETSSEETVHTLGRGESPDPVQPHHAQAGQGLQSEERTMAGVQENAPCPGFCPTIHLCHVKRRSCVCSAGLDLARTRAC